MRFVGHAGAERAQARLRAACAALAGTGSLALLLARVPLAVFLVALLGTSLSLLWWREARRSARRARSPESIYLAIHADGLVWADPPRATLWIPWTEIRELTVDEERVCVCVERHAAPPVYIDPCYPGVEIHELVRTLRNAWLGAGDSLKR
jgi:hypothetical protein